MKETFKRLTDLMKESEEIIFMTHRNMDLDGFGAALGLYEVALSLNKKPYIFINKTKNHKSIDKAFDLLKKENINYIFRSNYQEVIKNNTLLIVLDIHRKDIVEYPKLIDKCERIAIIDHHVKGFNCIKNTTFSFIDENYSSTNEIIANYLSEIETKINPLTATIMLSGIAIDTNDFNLNTTAGTYEAAAYLTKMGADSSIKQELLKESKDEFVRRQEFIRDSIMINDQTSMCLLDDNVYDKEDLATLAEELLQFDGVKASFAVGKIDKSIVGVSARSIGNINVEKIMAKLGGGGHTNEAAAQIKTSSINKVKKKILEIIGD